MVDKSLIQRKRKSLQKQIELLKLKLSYEKKIKELKRNLDSLKAKYQSKSKRLSGKTQSKQVSSKTKSNTIFTKKNAAIGTAAGGLATAALLYKIYKAYNNPVQTLQSPVSATTSPVNSQIQMQPI